jgi:hypothetical protein
MQTWIILIYTAAAKDETLKTKDAHIADIASRLESFSN